MIQGNDLNVTLGCDDLCGLEEDGMLHLNLLHFTLHSTYMHYTDVNEINYCLDGTITRQLYPRWLIPSTDPNAEQICKKKCTQFNGFERGKHRLVIPDIDEAHYNVNDVMTDNNSKNVITKVLFYDSISSPTASGKKKRIISAHIKEFIANLVGVFNKTLTKEEMFMPVEESFTMHCTNWFPTQTNGIDCGLFAVVNCLHIFDTRLQSVL